MAIGLPRTSLEQEPEDLVEQSLFLQSRFRALLRTEAVSRAGETGLPGHP